VHIFYLPRLGLESGGLEMKMKGRSGEEERVWEVCSRIDTSTFFLSPRFLFKRVKGQGP
jgi:hypothetical protein